MEDLVVIEDVLRGKRVLVTGHTGFKGAWLCAWLVELGAEPAGYALAPPTRPSLFETLGLERRMDDVRADVRDPEALRRRIDSVRPEFIVHMAAQALVRESYREPATTFATNVMGTVNLLEAVRQTGHPCTVIVVTTDKCYEITDNRRAFVEQDALGGHDPYSSSKAATEIVVGAYRRSFFPVERFPEHGVGLASVRAGNVLGGGDWSPDRIVPDVVRGLAGGQRPEIRNPTAVRPWQHVLDALSGYLWLAALMSRRGAAGLAEAWNFGPVSAETVAVGDLVDRILRAWGHGDWVETREAGAPHEAACLRLDCGKAVGRLGWRPVWNVDEAIAATVDWYRVDAAGREEMWAFTRAQIRDYTARARAAGLAWSTEAEVRP